MITEYIRAAMERAHYELLDNGRYVARIPGLKGLWAEAKTLEKCRTTLQEVLEDWLLLGLHHGHRIPLLGELDLNAPQSISTALRIAPRASRLDKPRSNQKPVLVHAKTDQAA